MDFAWRDHQEDRKATALSTATAALLERFGVRSDLPAVLDTIVLVCTTLGHDVDVSSLRHGVCRLTCGQRTAAMLQWDEDVVADKVNQLHPGAITSVEIVVDRKRR